MKKISFVFALLLFISAGAQKNLTIEETVMNRARIMPANLAQLQWIAGTTSYSWVRAKDGDEELVSSSGNGTKIKSLLTLHDLNAKIKASNLTALPQEAR